MKIFRPVGFSIGFILLSHISFAQENQLEWLELLEKYQGDVYNTIHKILEDNGGIGNLSQVNKKYNSFSPGRAESILSVKLAIQPTFEEKLQEAARLVGDHGELKKYRHLINHLADIHLGGAPRHSPRYTIFMIKLKKIFPNLKFVHHILYNDPKKQFTDGYAEVEPLPPHLAHKWSQVHEESSYEGCDPFKTFTDQYQIKLAVNDIIKNFNTGNDQDEDEKRKIPYIIFHQVLIDNPPEVIEKMRRKVKNKKDHKLTPDQKLFKYFIFPISDAFSEKRDFEIIKSLTMKLLEQIETDDSSSEDSY